MEAVKKLNDLGVRNVEVLAVKLHSNNLGLIGAKYHGNHQLEIVISFNREPILHLELVFYLD